MENFLKGGESKWHDKVQNLLVNEVKSKTSTLLINFGYLGGAVTNDFDLRYIIRGIRYLELFYGVNYMGKGDKGDLEGGS